jgi:hypothetical protein
MKTSEMKAILRSIQEVTFKLPQGGYVPPHFHVTEIGLITKHFIDCGGTIRHEKTASFQLWSADDTSHRLAPEKFLKIIALSDNILGGEDPEIEVEYQTDTVGRYGLDFNGQEFVLTTKQTACLAMDSCGIPAEKQKVSLSELTPAACCTPGSGCC